MKKDAIVPVKGNSLSLRTLFDVLFRRKWLILLTFLTTAVTAVLLAIYLPDQYESRMKILVRNMRSDTQITAERTDTSSGGANEVSEAQIISEIELLKSRDLLKQVVVKNDLAEVEPGRPAMPQEIERAVYKLEKDLDISPVKKANMIEVSYTSKSPEKSAEVLKDLSELYMEKHLKIHRPPGTFDFFKTQSDQYKQDLAQAENRLTGFQKDLNVVSIEQQKNLTITKHSEVKSRLDDLNGKIRETEKRINELQTQIQNSDKRIVTQNRTLPNQDSTERLNTLLVELKNRRIQLLAKYQPEDRLVKEVDDQIKTTTEALERASKKTYTEEASDINPLRQNLETELSKAKVEQSGQLALRSNLEKQLAEYQGELNKFEGATTIHDNLTRQVTEAEENYKLYAEKQEEARIADALDEQKISNVSIAESPTVPTIPYKSNRKMTAALGFLAGLFLGLGSAVIAELFRETIHTPRELEAFSGMPVLATVPVQKKQEELFIFDSFSNSLEETDLFKADNETDLEDFKRALGNGYHQKLDQAETDLEQQFIEN
jgi:uncharacterized protein involved in exopolysaccharide biosynthesis